jgi:acetyl esterase/lipase
MKNSTLKTVAAIALAVTLTPLCAMAQSTSANVPQLQPLIQGGNARVSMTHVPIFDSVDTRGIRTMYLNVPYAHRSASQYVDIYLPNEGTQPYPVIIAIHGGAFFMGNSKMRNDIQPMLAGLKRGYAVVSVNYRMSAEGTFPRAVNDVKAAVRFVRANAAKYHFDPDRIVAWGGSAGGNLVSMLGMTGNTDDLNGDNTENLEYSSRVQAVVDWFGPCDFRKFDEQFAQSTFPEHNSSIGDDSAESWYIGQNVLKDTTFTLRANPMTYISKVSKADCPYFLIEHGGHDTTVPIQQSENFYHALKAKYGSKIQFHLLPKAGHATPEFGQDDNLKIVFRFLEKALK